MFAARKTQFDELVDRATSEMQTSVDWQQNMVICDHVSRQENGARDAAAAIARRLTHKNPIVLNFAIALAEACVKNCGPLFHREVANRNFLNPVMKLVTDRTTPPAVREKLLLFLQDCSNEFRYDPNLSLVDTEFQNLKRQGVSIPTPPSTRKPESAKDLQKEEEELQLALALSMSEAESKKTAPRSSPDLSRKSPPPVPTSTSSGDKATSAICSAKALFDFGGTDKGEIGFKKGDIIEVTEKSDANWWKGYIKGKSGTVGLFPVNYVEELSATKSTAGKADNSNTSLADPLEDQINEESVNKLLELLRAINPQKDNIAKNEEIQDLFQQCNEMRPKVLELVIKYEKKKEELLQLNELFVKAKASYERLLAASVAPRPLPQTQALPQYQQQQQQQAYPPQYQQGGAPNGYGQPTSAAPGYPSQYPSQYPPQERGQGNPPPSQYSEPPRDSHSPMRPQEYPPTQSYSPQPAPYYPPSTGAPPQEYQSQYTTPPYPPVQSGPAPSYDPSAPPPSPSVFPREAPYVAAPSTFQEPPPSSYSNHGSSYPPQQQPQAHGQGGYMPPQGSQAPAPGYGPQGYGAPTYNAPSPKPQPEVSLIDLS